MSRLATISDSLVRLGAWTRRGRTLRPPELPWMLNIGSGLVVAPGWTNIDVGVAALIAPLPPTIHRLAHRIMPATSASKRDHSASEFSRILRNNRFVHHDVRYGLPVPDHSVDFIFTSHFLEHLYRQDALILLREARRALKPEGVLRVCVPDLDHVLALFSEGKRSSALDFFFLGPNASEFTRHRYMWDFSLLAKDLRTVGFANVDKCAFRQGATPNLDLLDNRPEETLFVEAHA
jgi:SAM-dependent methyltransferase